MTRNQVLVKLKAHMFFEYGSQREMARDLEVSDQFLSAVFNGKKEPTKKLLDLIGVRKVKTSTVRYLKK